MAPAAERTVLVLEDAARHVKRGEEEDGVVKAQVLVVAAVASSDARRRIFCLGIMFVRRREEDTFGTCRKIKRGQGPVMCVCNVRLVSEKGKQQAYLAMYYVNQIDVEK